MSDPIKKTRILAAALGASIAVMGFAFGAFWVRSLHDGIDQSRLVDAGQTLRDKMAVIGQVVLADMAVLRSQDLMRGASPMTDRVPDQFDLVVLYSFSREPIAGAYRVGKDHSIVALKKSTIHDAIPGDSAVFDRAATEGGVFGLLMYGGLPYVIGIKRSEGENERRGFILAGRLLDARKFIPSTGISEQTFDIFVPDDKNSLPADVEAAQAAMKSDQQFYGRLQRRGAGVGYLRFNDVFERPAFVLRFPWIGSGVSSERSSLIWLFIATMILGLSLHGATSICLTWIERQRKRSPGLSGMADHELREMVESFPGYAFALNQRQEYIAISRALAGVSGKESVYFVGRLFGSVSGENGLEPKKLMSELASSNNWPSTRAVDFSIAGLKDQFDYFGSCHFVSTRKILFVVLQAKNDVVDNGLPERSVSSRPIDMNDAAA